MKKSKKLSLQSLALVLMSFVLVAGVAFGMTGAWFSDSKTADKETVTLATGVEIELTKAEGATSYLVATNAAGDVVRDGTVFPGDTIVYTMNVKNLKEAAYIRFDVTVEGELASLCDIEDTAEADKVALAKDETETLTKTITLTGKNYTNEHANQSLSVTVTVYAIQQENYAAGNWAEVGSWTAVFAADGSFVA